MIEFRRAIETDIDFIVQAIIEAEKSGTGKLSYATMFQLSEPKVEEILKNCVMEDIPGQELCLSGFMLALIDGVRSGAVCSWIEGADDIPSAILKANILYHFLGAEVLERAAENSKLLEQITIPRETGALQIEAVYVSDKFRGLGIANQLILKQIEETIGNGHNVTKIQIQLAATNQAALHSYERLGFKTTVSRKCSDARILKLLPSDTKIMMEVSVAELMDNGQLKLEV